MPPIGPTSPSTLMVPVPAMTTPFASSSGVSWSTIPSANIVPALGPPMSSIWISTSTGKSNAGSMNTPSSAVSPPSVVATVRSVSALSRCTRSVTSSPGSTAARPSMRSWYVRTGAPSSATMTSPGSTTPSDPLSGTVPSTVSVAGTSYPSSVSAATVAFSCELIISAWPCCSVSSLVRPVGKTSSTGRTLRERSNQPCTTWPRFTG
ncbi:Uncharacterised protein [Mycobacteroides abscessus]|nr:Uncharacterised protein [Mycobacteroides abscessus]